MSHASPSVSLGTARKLAQSFAIDGELIEIHAHDRGHIHDTFVSTWQQASGQRRKYLHQHLNRNVFTDMEALMHNVQEVTGFLQAEHQKASPSVQALEPLQLVRTKSGQPYYDGEDGAWRTYHYIANTESFDLCQSEEQAFAAARAFGMFQRDLEGLPSAKLKMTIPRFFSTPYRWEQFQSAFAQASNDRLAASQEECKFAREREHMVDVIDQHLSAGRIPSRIVHGDTKLNNILFDASNGAARCVVDLDTCMPGYSLYDFGDLVRFTAATSTEDEQDLSKVGTDLGLYRALVAGYIDGTQDMLSDLELTLMPFSARLVTYTIGLRFLADFLSNDIYFKTAYPSHNLDRAKVQFRMVAVMESQESQMSVAPRPSTVRKQ